LLNPRSIALIGIPGDVRVPLARPLIALQRHGFTGRIFAVNPKYHTIGGLPCYRRVSDLPADIDAAWIAVPAVQAARTLADCVERGIRAAVIAASGFAEVGPEGTVRQAEIQEIAKRYGVAVLGPNSLGFVNCWDHVALTFSGLVERTSFLPGNVAVVSQSGGLGGSVANRLQDRRIGLSYFLSTGNEANVGLSECLEFLVEDDRTDIVIAIVEAIRDGQGFIDSARRALDAGKVIIALRLGTSPVGQRTATSHTGALVGSLSAWEAATTNLGVLTVSDIDDLVDAAVWCRRARCDGPVRRIVIVTSSGGAAIHTADRLSTAGIDVPPLDLGSAAELRAILPGYANPANPLDVTAGLPEETFVAALTAVARAKQHDAIVLPLNMLGRDQAAARIGGLALVGRECGITVAVCHFGGSQAAEAAALCDRLDIPAFSSAGSLASAARAGNVLNIARNRHRTRKILPVEPVATQERGLLSYTSASRLLEHAGIALPRQVKISTAAEAQATKGMPYPVVVKVVGRVFIHKTDKRAIRLDVRSDAELVAALDELDRTTPAEGREGFLVQEMVEGVEVIVGLLRDATFGLVLLLGRGGIATELAQDHRWLLLPVDVEDVKDALGSISGLRTLEGYRGVPRRDVEALIDTILKVQQLALALGTDVEEIELNPVIVGAEGQGCRAVDVLIRMSESAHGCEKHIDGRS
jgi:acyl-CoA synthetase (NDP forming)